MIKALHKAMECLGIWLLISLVAGLTILLATEIFTDIDTQTIEFAQYWRSMSLGIGLMGLILYVGFHILDEIVNG